MTSHARIDVIIVEHVAGGAVDHRGLHRRYAFTLGNERAGRVAAFVLRCADEDAYQRITGTGERYAHPVEHAAARRLTHVGRQFSRVARQGAFGEGSGNGGGLRLRSDHGGHDCLQINTNKNK